MLCRRFLGDPLADALKLPVPAAFGWERGGSAALILSLRLYSLLGRSRWTRRLLHGLHSVGAGMVHGRSRTREIGTATAPRSGCPYQMLAPPLAGDPDSSRLLDRISPIPPPVFSRFLRVFTVSPRRFQRAASRNPGPRNSGQGARTPFLVGLTPGVRNAWAGELQSQKRLWPEPPCNQPFAPSNGFCQKGLLSTGILRCEKRRGDQKHCCERRIFNTNHVFTLTCRVSRRWRNAGKGKERR